MDIKEGGGPKNRSHRKAKCGLQGRQDAGSWRHFQRKFVFVTRTIDLKLAEGCSRRVLDENARLAVTSPDLLLGASALLSVKEPQKGPPLVCPHHLSEIEALSLFI